MPNQPRLEADGLPSVDFAIRSPNVEETSSDDEGPSHRERRPDEHLSESNDGGLSGYLDEIPLTEMDGPTPGSPPRGEKPRGVPGSPSPLQIEDTEAPSAAPAVVGRAGGAALAFMPSPVRGRRSLSPKSVAEAPVGKARPNSYGRGNNTDLMDDSIMGASPDTEASLDSLASFVQDGHYHVPCESQQEMVCLKSLLTRSGTASPARMESRAVVSMVYHALPLSQVQMRLMGLV